MTAMMGVNNALGSINAALSSQGMNVAQGQQGQGQNPGAVSGNGTQLGGQGQQGQGISGEGRQGQGSISGQQGQGQGISGQGQQGQGIGGGQTTQGPSQANVLSAIVTSNGPQVVNQIMYAPSLSSLLPRVDVLTDGME